MKLKVLREEDGSVGGMADASVGSAISSGGADMFVSDNCSAASNIVNYGGRSNPYLSNLASYEHKKKKEKRDKYKDSNKNAGHSKKSSKRTKFGKGKDSFDYL